MSNKSSRVTARDVESIVYSVDRIKIDDETTDEPEQVIVQRTPYKNTKADVSQIALIKFPPVVIPISSAPTNATYSANVTLGDLVSAATIASAVANGAYAMRLNVKKHICIVSNMNNETSGSYDMTVVGSTIASGTYHYELENIDRPMRASSENGGNMFETSNMPMTQPIGTIIYTVIYDFNQVRAIASNVQADLTLDASVEAEVIFSYAQAPPNAEVAAKDDNSKAPTKVAPRKFF